jgi:hypothetical protein
VTIANGDVHAAERLMLDAATARGYRNGGDTGIRQFAAGMGISIDASRSDLAAHVDGVVLGDGARATIHVRRHDESGARFRTTFTIAHEVAHVLYNQAVGRVPANQAEYWHLEGICNRVAAILLVPEDSWTGEARGNSAISILVAASRVSNRLGVSRDVAIRRAVDAFPVVAAGAIEMRIHRTKGEIGRVSWIVPDPWLGLRGGSHLVRSHPLWPALVGGSGPGQWVTGSTVDNHQIARMRSARRMHFLATVADESASAQLNDVTAQTLA